MVAVGMNMITLLGPRLSRDEPELPLANYPTQAVNDQGMLRTDRLLWAGGRAAMMSDDGVELGRLGYQTALEAIGARWIRGCPRYGVGCPSQRKQSIKLLGYKLEGRLGPIRTGKAGMRLQETWFRGISSASNR